MSALIEERRVRLEDHRDDLQSALLILELIDDEECSKTPRLENLIELGKMALGSKLELLDGMLSRHEKKGGQQ
ncbi:MAG: hypothetical protein KUL86_10855 [Castellaniella sp.]|nr:hypothetical protein [Castellaniella sp.]